MAIRENDCVRLTQDFTGIDTLTNSPASQPAGAEGCAICAFDTACDVEFGDNIILTIPHTHLVKYWDVATKRHVA